MPFGQKKEESQHFLSLILRSDKIEAFVFEKVGETMRIVSEQEEFFQDLLDTASYEEILEITDKIVSAAEEEANLGDDISKTIFGLKEGWVADTKIKPEKLEILKKLCGQLGLTPVGFLTISEAIVGLLQKEEGAPPSAVLADVSKNNVSVTLVRAGKVIETKQSEIHQSAAFTVDTLLKHFEKVEILPSKIILLNEEEDLVQEFIAHQWSKSLPFLHLPQITNLPNGFMGKALILGIAKQMGAKVLEEFDVPGQKEAEEAMAQNPQAEPSNALAWEGQAKEESDSNIEYVSNDAQEFFGFVQGKDVSKIKPPVAEQDLPVVKQEEVTKEIPEEVKIESEGKQLIPMGAMLLMPKVMGFVGSAFELSKKSVSRLPAIKNLPIKNKGILFMIAPLLILVLLLLYYFLGLQAKVLISVSPKIVEKTQDITFSTTSSFDNNVIKGEFISVTEDGTTSAEATGKKETGDKAKGTVTIFNSSTQTKTYPAKTKITSSNDLIFVTLGAVTVASRSGDVPPTAGTNKVNVEAEKFGTEYNLPSNTKFPAISQDSDIAAKNDNPFSGGTKKDIMVFSKDDAQKLRDNLIKDLEEKAKAEIQVKSEGREILPEFITAELTKENFDKDIDEEAKTVILTGTVSYQTIAYDKNEFQEYLKKVFGDDVNAKNVELSFTDITVKGNDVLATLKAKAKIYPKISTDELGKKISGKSFTQAENEIMSLPQIEDVKISFSPNLFFFPKIVPRIQKNIKIEILENG